MPYDVFISHTKQDKQIAASACDSLEQAGITCWIAPRNLVGGSDWPEAIIDAIKHSRAMLLIFSSSANNSPQIKREVTHAFEQNLRVFTFRVEDVNPSGSLEYYLDSLHWLDAFDSEPEKHLARLTADVSGYLRDPTRPAVTPPAKSLKPSPPLVRYSLPKWWMYVAAGLFAIVLIIVGWRYLNPRSPILVNANPSPTPLASSSIQPGPSVTVNPTISPRAVGTTTDTPTPATIKTPGPNPDNTDPRIAKALGVLGNPNPNELAAMDAIISLAPLIKKSVEHQRTIIPILTSYIQRTAVYREGGNNRPAKPPPSDIQAAITVLAQRGWGYDQGEPRLELSYADLRGIDFKRGDFDGVNLVNAHLERADLTYASFRCANLNGAYVKGIDVSRTDFDGTELSGLRESNATEMGVALRNRGTMRCTH